MVSMNSYLTQGVPPKRQREDGSPARGSKLDPKEKLFFPPKPTAKTTKVIPLLSSLGFVCFPEPFTMEMIFKPKEELLCTPTH